jgi:hypothetical protein
MELLQCLVCKQKALMAACLLVEADAQGLLDNIGSVCFQNLVLEALAAGGHHLQARQLQRHLVSRGWPAEPGYQDTLCEQYAHHQHHQELANCNHQQHLLLAVPDPQATAEPAANQSQQPKQVQQQQETNGCASSSAGSRHYVDSSSPLSEALAASTAVNAATVAGAKIAAEFFDLPDEAAFVDLSEFGSTTAEDSVSVHSEAVSVASTAMTATATTSSMAENLIAREPSSVLLGH